LTAAEIELIRERIVQRNKKEKMVTPLDGVTDLKKTKIISTPKFASSLFSSSDTDSDTRNNNNKIKPKASVEIKASKDFSSSNATIFIESKEELKIPKRSKPKKMSIDAEEVLEKDSKETRNSQTQALTSSETMKVVKIENSEKTKDFVPLIKQDVALLNQTDNTPAPKLKRPRGRKIISQDLSFFPEQVQAICQRLVNFISRTSIVNEADYILFEQQFQTFRQERQVLEKVCDCFPLLLLYKTWDLIFDITNKI
jgi:prolyl oligopeptidase PreP (S9A serine peptidase family)